MRNHEDVRLVFGHVTIVTPTTPGLHVIPPFEGPTDSYFRRAPPLAPNEHLPEHLDFLDDLDRMYSSVRATNSAPN